MEKTLFDKLFRIAEEFGAIAKKVNESSLDRKKHSEKAIDNLDFAHQTCANLLNEIQTIAKENLNLRNKHSQILTTFETFLINIAGQNDLIKELKENKAIKNDLANNLTEFNIKMEETLQKGKSFVSTIIQNSNQIVLLDKIIIKRKTFQKDRIKKLKKSTETTLKDAEKAIEGSGSNLERGLAMVKRFTSIDRLFAQGDKAEIKKTVNEANSGWKLAIKVNNSSTTQFEFAEEVNNFTKTLHDESLSIKDLVNFKRDLFTKNLEPIAELAVLVAVEMFDYITVKDLVKELDIENTALDEKNYRMVNDLAAYILSACEDIEMVGNFNYDMTDSIAANSRLGEKAVDLTNKENIYYAAVKNETEAMTEATRYPVEGSAKNIRNAMEVEKSLKEIMKKV